MVVFRLPGASLAKAALFVALLLAAACEAITAHAGQQDAPALLTAARQSIASMPEGQLRRTLLFEILATQKWAQDWAGMGETLAELDRMQPVQSSIISPDNAVKNASASTSDYERLHPALDRALMLAHQNRREEARHILRQLIMPAQAGPAAAPAGEALLDDFALQQIIKEQIDLGCFSDAVLTAQTAKDHDRKMQMLYVIFWSQAQSGDKEGALQTASLTDDPSNAIQALLSFEMMQTQRGSAATAATSRKEAWEYARTMPEGDPRRHSIAMVLSESARADDTTLLISLIQALPAGPLQDTARLDAVQSFWHRAETRNAASLAAQTLSLVGPITDEALRRQAFKYVVMLRARAGDAAGAAALAHQKLAEEDPTLLLLLGKAIQHAKTPASLSHLLDLGSALATSNKGLSYQAAESLDTLILSLLEEGDSSGAIVAAEQIPADEGKLHAYREIAYHAVQASDNKPLSVLRGLLPKLEKLVDRLPAPRDRAGNYNSLMESYAKIGMADRIAAIVQKIPDAANRAWMLARLGQWQAAKGKPAAGTLHSALQTTDQITDADARLAVRLEILRALLDMGAKPEVVHLLSQIVPEALAMPEASNRDAWLPALADIEALCGDPDGALQTASAIKEPNYRADTLRTLAARFAGLGEFVGLRRLLPGLPDDKARNDLLTALVWQHQGNPDARWTREILSLASGATAKANILLAAARMRIRLGDRFQAQTALTEALTWIAEASPSLPTTYAQVDAAKVLGELNLRDKAETLLRRDAEQTASMLKPGRQPGWNLPPTEPLTATRLSAESEAEVQLLDIAQAQSGLGDLEGALQTIRRLPGAQLREYALRENVYEWIKNGNGVPDVSELTRLTRPAERPFALLAAAHALLPPENIGL